MMKISLKLTVAAMALVSSSAMATTYAVDGRTDAMGGAGTAAADYLTGAFYNPALVALYTRKDDAGILIPGIGVQLNDQDSMLDDVDELQTAINNSDVAGINQKLLDLEGDEFYLGAGATFAIAIPNRYLSTNIFAKTYLESYARPIIDTANYNNSDITMVAFGLSEVGVAFAKYFNILGQHVSLGVSPKIQRFYTYNYATKIENFDTDGFDTNETKDSAVNFDVGAVWFYGPFRIAVAGKNMVDQSLETASVTATNTYQYTYELNRQVTAGLAFVGSFTTLSADMDLIEQTRFTGIDDDVQMLRFGAEFDIFGQVQLRGGFSTDMSSNVEDTISGGIGFSPLGIVNVDVALSYAGENSYGGAVNLALGY